MATAPIAPCRYRYRRLKSVGDAGAASSEVGRSAKSDTLLCAKHESTVFEEVVKNRGSGETNVGVRAEQETALSKSLGRLFALAEDYPDLKASEGFQQLHTSLVEIEEHLQFSRRYYNGAVRDNNNLVESFPSNIIAGFFKFSTAEFFEIELASQRSAPDVNLSN